MGENLFYGLGGDGKLRHISEVANGLDCGCYCPNCSFALIAKNKATNIRIPHFAHASDRECKGAVETAIHLLAKEVLLELKGIHLPDFHYDYAPENDRSLCLSGQFFSFDAVLLEKRVAHQNRFIIPDAIGVVKNKPIYIEFAKTHFVEEGKKDILISSGVSCIEIDLGGFEQSRDSIKEALLGTTKAKYWLTNPTLDFRFRHYKEEAQGRLEKIKHLENSVLKKKPTTTNSAIQLFDYQLSRKYEIFELSNPEGLFLKCPLLKHKKESLRDNVNSHNMGKIAIKEGEAWDGEIHGNPLQGEWIELNGKRKQVTPSHNDFKNLPHEERVRCKQLIDELIMLKVLHFNPVYGHCTRCRYNEDLFKINYESHYHSICRFRNDTGVVT
ncbi:competence protein CoiA family protein [Rufibacter latericius]|uniref:Competence protein CoiA-like family protein n=1 Tax=Rufibacter latericius TaxID=2487040 RepID=A0A3M9MDD7_9BACT|nr:competence protein CoiA family protein [Rufibacter latericius]RNI22608.1 hypothetical protein EFB08_21165 [Rufibacter latericius]